jgi:hypothetical protein
VKLLADALSELVEVMTRDLVWIELEVRVVDESLIGQARTADGKTREFAGWLGLMMVLEALLPAPAQEPGADRLEDPWPSV